MQLMQVAPSGGQICNECKWRHLVAKFATNAITQENATNYTEDYKGRIRFVHLSKKSVTLSKFATDITVNYLSDETDN